MHTYIKDNKDPHTAQCYSEGHLYLLLAYAAWSHDSLLFANNNCANNSSSWKENMWCIIKTWDLQWQQGVSCSVKAEEFSVCMKCVRRGRSSEVLTPPFTRELSTFCQTGGRLCLDPTCQNLYQSAEGCVLSPLLYSMYGSECTSLPTGWSNLQALFHLWMWMLAAWLFSPPVAL